MIEPVRDRDFSPEENEALRAEFGIPPDLPSAARLIDCWAIAPNMEGWTLTILGIPLSFEELEARPPDHPAPLHASCYFAEADGHARFHIVNDLGNSPEVREFFEVREPIMTTFRALIVYSARLHHRDAPLVFAEQRWHPKLGFRTGIGGLDYAHELCDVDRAHGALAYFDDLQYVRRGRRSGTKHYRAGDDAIFEADIERAIRACVEAGERVGKTTVSRRIGCNRDTLSGYLKDFPRVRLKTIETKIRAE